MNNKFPGKDISIEDIKTKFPLVTKNKHNQRTKFKLTRMAQMNNGCSQLCHLIASQAAGPSRHPRHPHLQFQ